MKILLRVLFGAVVLAGNVACQRNVPVEWEHGWKTNRVTATRYQNEAMGYNIGFVYPKNPNDCDRAEIFEFIEAHGGSVFQGGGYRGAPMYVKFTGVTDRPTADKKLREILPGLDKLMDDITAGRKIPKIVNPNAKVWPDTDPPDKSDPNWEFNNNLSMNGTQYKKAEVSPGKWQWIVDEKAMKSLRDAESHKWALWSALTTRVLTDAELKEVDSYGSYLNIQPNVSYNAGEKLQELHNALLIQQMLRHDTKAVAIPDQP
jgi:hypothetical protein